MYACKVWDSIPELQCQSFCTVLGMCMKLHGWDAHQVPRMHRLESFAATGSRHGQCYCLLHDETKQGALPFRPHPRPLMRPNRSLGDFLSHAEHCSLFHTFCQGL